MSIASSSFASRSFPSLAAACLATGLAGGLLGWTDSLEGDAFSEPEQLSGREAPVDAGPAAAPPAFPPPAAAAAVLLLVALTSLAVLPLGEAGPAGDGGASGGGLETAAA